MISWQRTISCFFELFEAFWKLSEHFSALKHCIFYGLSKLVIGILGRQPFKCSLFCGGEGEGFFSLPVPYNSSFLEAVMAGTHAGQEPCR